MNVCVRVCARAHICLWSYELDFLCVFSGVYMCTLEPFGGRFYYHILVSFPKPQTSLRYFITLGKHPEPVNSLSLSLHHGLSTKPLSAVCVPLPGLVSGCICPITQGFTAANHEAMPHHKVLLPSCTVCLNKHLNKHLDNHSSPQLKSTVQGFFFNSLTTNS